MVLDLNAIFPSMTLPELAKFVRDAEGSFDDALMMIMAVDPQKASSSGNSVNEKEHSPVAPNQAPVEPSLEFDGNAELIRLRAQYSRHIPNIISILGEGVQDEVTILRALERTKGDTQEAVLELLSLPERVSDQRSELSSSRNALRQSANSFSAGSGLRSSSGLEELPINVNMAQLDQEPGSRFSSASIPMATPSLMVRAPAPSPASSAPSEPSLASSLASSSGHSVSPVDGTTSDGNDSDTITYEFSDEDDEDAWLTDPQYEEVRAVVFGTDFITQMLQEEYDHLVAQELAREFASGRPETSVSYAIAQTKAQSIPPPEPRKGRKWDPFQVPVKKQVPSGPKYIAPIPASSYVPASPVAAVPAKLPEPQIDQRLVEEFVREHPVIFAPTVDGKVKRPDVIPVLKAKVDESLNIASTIKQLKQLYLARVAGAQKKPARKEPARESDEAKQVEEEEALLEGPIGAALEAPALFDITETLEKLFASARPKTADQCLIIQQNEIRALRAMFSTDRIHVSESVPTVISISLNDPSFEVSRPAGLVGARGDDFSHLSTQVAFRSPLHLHLVVALPPLYPDISPAISVRSLTPTCPINRTDLMRLESHLRSTVRKTFGRPGLAELAADAEKWLCTDTEVRKAALLDFAKQNEVGEVFETEPHLFQSLKRIFNFGEDYSVIDSNDVLNQRAKLLKRAILVLINGPAVINPPTPGNPDPAKEFPIRRPDTGEIDEELSLRGLGLTVAAVRIILQHYNWNLGKLSSAYLNSLARGTFEIFLSESGVAPVADRYAMQHHLPRALTEVLECPSCLDYLPFHAMFGLVCGHMLCKDCYSRYVDAEVSRSAGLASIACPSPGCKYVVDQVSMAGLLSDTRWSQYINMTVSQFVQANPALSWCPSKKGCQHIVQLGALDADGISAVLAGVHAEELRLGTQPIDFDKAPLVIQCKCSYTYCNGCARIGGHFPASCSECDDWDKTHPGDAPLRDHDIDNLLSEQFVRSHSRACPQCGAAISKNGGCVHMMCTACRHEFCWVCQGHWTVEHYACSESRMGEGDSQELRLKTSKTFDSLLARHRNFSYANVGRLRQKLTTAMYRSDKPDPKKLVGANAVNTAHLKLDKALTLEDVPAFIEALEVVYVAHYIITNACKAGYSLTGQEIPTVYGKTSLMSLIHRGLDDLNFLTQSFSPEVLRKHQLYHVNAGIEPLKTTVKLIVGHLNTIRLAHLADIARTH